MSDHTEIVDALARMQARAVAAEERAATAERQRDEARTEIERLASYFRDEDVDEGHEGDWRGDSTVTTALRVLRKRRAAEADAARLRTALVKMHRWAVGPEPESDEERDAYFAAVREADAALDAAPPAPQEEAVAASLRTHLARMIDWSERGDQHYHPEAHSEFKDDLAAARAALESAPPIPAAPSYTDEMFQQARREAHERWADEDAAGAPPISKMIGACADCGATVVQPREAT